MNHLINEKSQYLLQHANNPVDWYPWGNEAFHRANQENKPIFLSIGYGTCHWCHVMACESFENETVAKFLNDSFICIKVDREERPDIDSVYMDVCQMMTGSGGWPLTIIMTPDKKPFYAATYIPKERGFGVVGLVELLPQISQIWKEHKDDLVMSAEQIIAAIVSEQSDKKNENPNQDLLKSGYKKLTIRFDSEYGGFGNAPKFPTPHILLFLLRYWKKTKSSIALSMVTKTLDEIRKGGIYDQIGGGIHRYSTDPQWRTPHFEKMLYDQALLVMAYTEAYQITQKPEYRKIVDEIFTYISRDLASPEGAFYSAEDADSEGKEGTFYLWTNDEFESALNQNDILLAREMFNVRSEGNFIKPLERVNSNILHLTKSLGELAKKYSISSDEILARYEQIRYNLLTFRKKRVRPNRDDKILTDWNGLIIAALAKAGQVFGIPQYIEKAKHVAQFIISTMRNSDGELYHRYYDGQVAVPAFGEDYVCVIWGFFELYEATFDENYLVVALDLNKYFINHFWDYQGGGFFTVADTSEQLIIRKKEIYDSAIPSCNSIAYLNLIRLARITGNYEFETLASKIAATFAELVKESPISYTFFLCALDYSLGPTQEIVIVGDKNGNDTKKMLQIYRSQYLPSSIVILKPIDNKEAITDLAPYTKLYHMINEEATVYVCTKNTCINPISKPEKFLGLLIGND